MTQKTSLRAAMWRAPATRRLFRAGFPLVVGVACVVLLNTRLEGLDFRAVADVVRSTSVGQWIAAAAATALSFWAIGTYDVVVHRHLRTGVPKDIARVTGASSIAIAQVLGLGIITGSLARWRMLSGTGGGIAAAVTGVVSASFLGAWALVTVLLALVLPGVSLPIGVTLGVIAASLGFVTLAFWSPQVRIRTFSLRLPSLRTLGAIAGLTLIDIVAAAAALHVLMPAGLNVGFEILLPVFAIALGCGLFSSTPGGAGPFELAILSFLPLVDQEPLLGAILAWRLVYYAAPAILAIVPLTFPYRVETKDKTTFDLSYLDQAKRAECGVVRQNGATCTRTGTDLSVLAETGQCLTLMFDPLRGQTCDIPRALALLAQDRMLVPAIYKCSAPLANEARRAGWKIVRIADDAIVDPTRFCLDGAGLRQLRRKLRKAEKAGVSVQEEPLTPTLLDELAETDAKWLAKNGKARGFSMGRFCPDYISHQKIFVARLNGAVLGFVTFHYSREDMALDLMRCAEDMPDGTMHMLIGQAIESAKTEGRERISLAAIPAHPKAEARLVTRLRSEIATRSGGNGLTRFKESFGAYRQPLYAAAPTYAGLTLALADIARAIHNPQS